MTGAQQAIEEATNEVKRLKQSLSSGTAKQVSGDDDRRIIKATALTWFEKHRVVVIDCVGDDLVRDLDDLYRELIAASDKASTRKKHFDLIKGIRKKLAKLQSEQVIALSVLRPNQRSTSDTVPSFAPLVTDHAMQGILANRWNECIKCVEAEAPLAATVMMGGLLEALLLARVNQLTDKRPVFNAKSAPKDRQTGKPLNLTRWGLKDFIAVSHEIKWISPTTKDVGNVVRDYRNYVHPQKEHSHGVSISPDDARMLWEIAKSVARQVLKPA